MLAGLDDDLVFERRIGATGWDFAECSTADGSQLEGSGSSSDLGPEETDGRVLDDDAVLEEERQPLRRLGPTMNGPEALWSSHL